MDPLGKKGEQAFEGVQNLSNRLEEVESHLSALDSALQDFQDSSQQLMREQQEYERSELEQIEDIAEETVEERESIEELETRISHLEDSQRENARKIEEILESELLSTISRVRDLISKTEKKSQRMRQDLTDLESRVEELETELVLEMNKRDYDFQQKLDAKEFESEKAAMMEEIRKLRASVNVLADELDKKDEIEVE